MTDFLLTGPALETGTLTDIASRDRIGLDTEFMREKTYFSQLCLLQVSTPAGIVCIDPLDAGSAGAGPDDAFWKQLTAPEWVVHSARQDIEVIYHTSGCMPRSVFDTQVAAALLGFQPQIGYAGLVETLFGAELEKTHTRADWSKRPLRRELLEYAAEDVKYLLPAWEELTNRLEERGRLQWAIEDSADLLSPSLYSTDPTLAIERLKAARNLRGRSYAAARRLAAWREAEALRSNRPRQWIMRDAVLIDIAVIHPRSRAALAGIAGMAERTARRAGNTILGILDEASGDDSSYQPPRRPTEAQKTALKAMQKLVAGHAADLDIAAEVLASRKELSAAVQGDRDTRLFRGWRRELFGERLLELLEHD